MRVLASLDGEAFHLIEEHDLGEVACGAIKYALKAKEKRRMPSPDNPSQEEKRKEKEPPLPPCEGGEVNLFGEECQTKTAKKVSAPPYKEIYGMAKRYFPDWNFRTTTDKRNRKIRRVWRANGIGVLVFEELFKMAQASDFLNSRNGHTFKGKLSLSWIIERAEDILDGKYTNDRMEWALTSRADEIEAVVVGEGRKKINPMECKHIGTDDITGLPKYIRQTK